MTGDHELLPVLPSLEVARRVIYDLESTAPRIADQLDAMRQNFEAFEGSFPEALAEWAYNMKRGGYRLVKDRWGRPCKTIGAFLFVWLQLPPAVLPQVLKQKRNKFDYLVRRWAERSVETVGESRQQSRKAETYARAAAYMKRTFPQLTRDEQERFSRLVDDLCTWPVRQATPTVELRALEAHPA